MNSNAMFEYMGGATCFAHHTVFEKITGLLLSRLQQTTLPPEPPEPLPARSGTLFFLLQLLFGQGDLVSKFAKKRAKPFVQVRK